MSRQGRASLVLGILLILIGVLFVAAQRVDALKLLGNIQFEWPFYVVGAGALILIIGLLTGAPSMAILAALVSGIGSVLYYQNINHDWASWNFMWTLIPGFVGVGNILAGMFGGDFPRSFGRGLNLIMISAVLFLIFAAIFQRLEIVGSYGLVLLLILFGFYLIRIAFLKTVSPPIQPSSQSVQEASGTLGTLASIFFGVLGVLGFITIIGAVLEILAVVLGIGILGFAGFEGFHLFQTSQQNQIVNNIIFAGKVVSPSNKEWLDNRLVIVFLNGQEVGRAITSTGEFKQSGQGVEDGIYIITLDNPYKFSYNTINKSLGNDQKFVLESPIRGNSDLYSWTNQLKEGGTYSVEIPEKNIRYVIKSIAGNAATLPQELLNGTTIMKTDGSIDILPPKANNSQASISSSFSLQSINFNTNIEKIEGAKITIPINNCAGSTSVLQNYTQSETYIHSYSLNVSGEVNADIPLPIEDVFVNITANIKANYGFDNGQIETKTFTYSLSVPPKTNITYILTNYEIWEDGTAQAVTGAETVNVPFKVKTDLIQQLDTASSNCN